MALTSSVIVKRTFLELAEEPQLPRARIFTDSVLSMLKVGDMDHCCSLKLGDADSCLSTDCGSEAGSAVSCWADESEDELDERTTVMLRGLDSSMDRDELLLVLNASCFRGCFDFMYVPCDLITQSPKGFGFVNFSNHMDALKFQLQPPVALGIEARAFWSDKEQGLAENVARYRNSPLMHRSVPKHLRPSLVRMDSLVALPQPTQNLKAPKVKRSSC